MHVTGAAACFWGVCSDCVLCRVLAGCVSGLFVVSCDCCAGRLLPRRVVEARTGLSRSGLYRAVRDGSFPSPFKVSARAVRWSEAEVAEWLSSLPRATVPPR